MAENKKSFLLYCDTIHTVKKLSNEDAGQLFKHILSYVNDENPTTDNLLVDIAFEPIKQSLKRDLIRYEEIVNKRRLAGLASAENRKQNQQMLTHVESVQQSSTKSTDSVSDSVNDSDSVSDIKEDNNLSIFDEFRKSYLGTKRGNETEFKNFTKHKDWKTVLPTLKNCLITQIEQRKKLKDNGKFVPEWKNLQTWINQRCWEEEYFFNENKVQTRRGNNIPKGGW